MRGHGRWVAVAAALAAAALSAGAGTAVAGTAAASAARPARSDASPGWRVVKTWGCGNGAVNSVTSVGPRSGWATGYLTLCSSHRQDLLIARWDGRSWRQVRPPAGFAGGKSVFVGHAVAALSASYAWTFVDRGPKSFALLYQSGRWRTFELPNYASVDSAVAFSTSNVWAFGRDSSGSGAAYRFNGRAWRQSAMPVAPQSTASPGQRNIWAVGDDPLSTIFPFTLAHWTGRWHNITFPDLNNTELSFLLNSVVSDGTDGAWVATTPDIGLYFDGGVLLHWTGTTWVEIGAPSNLYELGPISHDGHGGLWMMAANYKDCPSGGCIRFEMLHYSTAHGWSAPDPIGAFQVNTLRLIPGTRSLWAGGYTFTSRTTHAAILKFGR